MALRALLFLFFSGGFVDGATFFGVSEWRASFSIWGDLNPRQSAVVVGESEVTVTVENGRLTIDSLILRPGRIESIGRSDGTFTNSTTFEQTTIRAEVSVDPFAFAWSTSSAPLLNRNGEFGFELPNSLFLSAPIEITGSYSIIGETDRADGTFGTVFSRAPVEPRFREVDTTDFPNSIGLQNFFFAPFGSPFIPGFASATVDGIPIDLEFSGNSNGITVFAGGTNDFITLTQIPEPSSGCLILLATAATLLTRNRRGSPAGNP